MIIAVYLFLVVARAALALWYARRQPRSSNPSPVTIIQPILSGDPLLERTLRENLDAHPDARFLWMIDEDDAEAARIGVTHARSNLMVVATPPPRDGENPKLAKLIRALPLVSTPRLTVLDDDTFLPARLPEGPLVTGLPVFAAKQSIYERLIGGFVNGNALLTYLPAAQLRLQRTINGMIYAVNTEQIRQLGGFAAAGHELTDDYAVARLYQRHVLPITQSITPALVTMTVVSASHYVRLMRRWMIFAASYFGDNATLSTVFWIALPGLLPLLGLFATGRPLLWMALLLGKTLINRSLLWHVTKISSTPIDLLFEVAADLLTPLWMLLAFIQPRSLTWRSRTITMEDGIIRYK